MTLTEFLVKKTSVESDQCKCCKDKPEEEEKGMEFSSCDKSKKRAQWKAEHMLEIHTTVVEAAWEAFSRKLTETKTDEKEAEKLIETSFKKTVDTAIKTVQLALMSQLLV